MQKLGVPIDDNENQEMSNSYDESISKMRSYNSTGSGNPSPTKASKQTQGATAHTWYQSLTMKAATTVKDIPGGTMTL